MKGTMGLLVAAALGIVGAFCNWFYVHKQASGYERVLFVGIKQDAQINAGDKIQASHLMQIAVPREYVGNLEQVGLLWEDRALAINQPATRPYLKSQILLAEDVVTPPQKDLADKLGENEVMFPVLVDSRTFVAEHYNPGDQVWFWIASHVDGPTPAGGSNLPSAGGDSQMRVGPFFILALGNRKGTDEVADAFRKRTERENVITVALKFIGGKFDPQAERLFSMMNAAGSRGVQVFKQPKDNK